MKKTAFSFVCAAMAACVLTACDVTAPSRIKTGDIRVIEDTRTAAVPATHVDKTQVDIVAGDYRRNATGPLRMVMPYAGGDSVAAAQARRTAALYQKTFAAAGVRDVYVDFTPVDRAAADRAVLHYRVMQARAPEGCRPIPGRQGAGQLSEDGEYAFGCETKTLVGKMVARPADLLGRDGVPPDTSRRAGEIIEKNRAGIPNQPLQGESASGG